MKRLIAALMAASIWTAAVVPALAQDAARPAVSGYAKPVAYPNANAAAVADHFNKARKLAADDLYAFFDTLCVQDQLYRERTNGAQYLGMIGRYLQAAPHRPARPQAARRLIETYDAALARIAADPRFWLDTSKALFGAGEISVSVDQAASLFVRLAPRPAACAQ